MRISKPLKREREREREREKEKKKKEKKKEKHSIKSHQIDIYTMNKKDEKQNKKIGRDKEV